MHTIPCSESNCENAVSNKKRSLCKSHYNQWYYREQRGKSAGNPVKLLEVPGFTCAECGTMHGPAMKAGKARKIRKYCNRKCMEAKFSTARKEARHAAAGPRSCALCSADISGRKLDARFCSAFCSDISRGARLAAPLPEITCALEGCEVIFSPMNRRTKCCSENHGAIHCNRQGRASGRYANDPWDERRKANHQKRRAQKLNLPAEIILPIDVYERDEWVCGICALPVDRALSYPDPMSPSLDHVKPLSLGGHHVMGNVQLAHLSCNVRKGNRVEADAMSA